jgi:hypothetical protein
MAIVLDGTTGITTPNVASDTSTLGPLTQALNLGSTGQIVFPATQNASANANTLDDYEEGTWTPSISGITVTSTFSTYTKTGNTVFIRSHMSCSANPGSTFNITGLPFTSSASSRTAGVLVIQDASAGYAQRTGPTCTLSDSSTAVSVNLQGVSSLDADDRINLFVSYAA